MAQYRYGTQGEPASEDTSSSYVNFVGAGLSLALMVAMIGWGAKTLMRDASGVPVVQALDGPMRSAPDDPGGVQAANQGLSVNQIASSQTAVVAPAVTLAPQPDGLGDQEIMAGAQETQPIVNETVVENIVPAAARASVAPVVNPTILTSSLRPRIRPATPLGQAALPASAARTIATVPAGTRLAQLGAYPSAEMADKEWKRLSAKFANFMVGKKQVIQRAETGGKIFYRLRVQGFADQTDARRFCSALNAKEAPCYPVIMK